MTELLFWETTLGKTPVSFAIDAFPGFVLGIKPSEETNYSWGWHDLTIYIGPLSLTFTVYVRPA